MSSASQITNPRSKEDILYIFNSFIIPKAGGVFLSDACREFLMEWDKKYNINKPKTENTNQIRSSHYGGADNPYEAIKVIDVWKANFNLGNVIKYICRVSHRYYSKFSKEDSIATIDAYIEDLKKARTYLDFEIEKLEKMK